MSIDPSNSKTVLQLLGEAVDPCCLPGLCQALPMQSNGGRERLKRVSMGLRVSRETPKKLTVSREYFL